MNDTERTISFRVQFGYRLRQCRKRQRLSQEKLAKEIEMPQTIISRWERGANLPNLEHFNRLLKALDVKAKALLPLI